MSDYHDIIRHYESCLQRHGDTHLGVDWPKAEDAEMRYKIMLELIREYPQGKDVSLLDFGCGTAHLLEYVRSIRREGIQYSGLDISSKFTDLAKQKFPEKEFFQGDVLDRAFQWPSFDYIIMNGVFTEKRDLHFDTMWAYFESVLRIAFTHCRNGLAFNVMSKNVDWEREDLFHVSLDMLTAFLCRNISRNFIIRNDYGLYESTIYVYR